MIATASAACPIPHLNEPGYVLACLSVLCCLLECPYHVLARDHSHQLAIRPDNRKTAAPSTARHRADGNLGAGRLPGPLESLYHFILRGGWHETTTTARRQCNRLAHYLACGCHLLSLPRRPATAYRRGDHSRNFMVLDCSRASALASASASVAIARKRARRQLV